MKMTEYIYEVVVEPSYKNLLGKMPTMLVSAGKLEEKPPRQLINPILVRAMASIEKGMYSIQRIDPS